MSLRLLAPLAAIAALTSCPALPAAEAIAPRAGLDLFNGRNLAGWVKFAPSSDPAAPETWTVADGVIQCSGKPNGYLRTEARYRDYRLTVQWRWVPVPPPVDAQGRPRNRNSGILLHTQSPDNVWPKSLEAQLMEGSAGDFYIIGGVDTAEHAAAREKAVAAAGADEEAVRRARNNRRLQKGKDSAEKPLGEWNTYEIVCAGSSVTLRVNGVDQNRATGVTVADGCICLQSEGAPIQFRHVRIEPLK